MKPEMPPLSGRHFSFDLEVPYELYKVGPSQTRPLLVYLHGFGQNIADFRPQTKRLASIEAYHLFVQAPYVVYDRNREKKVREWGWAWYLYDGEQEQFLRSLERTSAFLQKVIEDLRSEFKVNRTALLGYSMGGYQAAHFALSRPELVSELVVIGSRIKTEAFRQSDHGYDGLHVLALHGAYDRSVKSGPQQKSCDELSKWGADVTFIELDAGHKLKDIYLKEAKQWFLAYGYE